MAEALASIQESHGELVPLLERMLAWEPEQRPDGATLERELMEAADELRGSSLRSWASSAIAPMLETQTGPAKDPIGLAGEEYQIEQVGAEHTLGFELPEPRKPAARPVPVTRAEPAPSPRPAEPQLPSEPAPRKPTPIPQTLPLHEASPGAPEAAPTPPAPSPPPPAAPAQRPAPARGSSTLGLAIKSLLVGAGIGFILVVIAALVVLGS